MAILMLCTSGIYSNTWAAYIIKLCLKGVGKFVLSNGYALTILLNLAFSLSYAEKVRNGYYYSI